MNPDHSSTNRASRRRPCRSPGAGALFPALLAGLLASASQAWQDGAGAAEGEAPEPTTESGEATVVDEATEAPPLFLESLPPPDPAPWPGVDRLARVLADGPGRDETLLTLAAMLTVQSQPRSADAEAAAARAQLLLGNRNWLKTLVERYGYGEPRSPMLDPAAWRVQVQLDRVGLTTSAMASPLGPGREVLLAQVFDRSNPDLAAATLPELLWHMEVESPMAWQALRRRLENDPWLALALQAHGAPWTGWPVSPGLGAEELEAATPPGPVNGEEGGRAGESGEFGDRLLEDAQRSLEVMFDLATSVGPPDPLRVASLRYELLAAIPYLDPGRRSQAAGLLHLAGLVDGLYRQDYLHFTESLLAITARLQNEARLYPEQSRAFAAWLAQLLPDLSASYGRDFSTVDPTLNSVIATAYDVSRALSREVTQGDLQVLRQQIANAVAGLGLLIPDLGYYFDQPIRDPIAGGVDACTGIAGELDQDGSPAMTRELFDDCQETLVALANFEAREAQLAGDADGPFGPSQLQRELGLTAGQRINYGIGYLHDRFATGCELPQRPLPNPLEWAYLATFMVWFAEQSPVYFQAPENEARLERMRSIGQELVREIAEQVDCLSGAGAVLNDPVDRVTADYRTRLRTLGQGLDTARSEFRSARLAPGADIRLDGDANQSTAYRPSELTIGPCDLTKACEMTGQLSSTRALTGLFADRYLVADQSGLGTLEICYDNMEWVDRRLEPVRPGDDNVANFFGRLAFDLRGRYRDGDGARDLFAFRFTAPDVSHYLFAAQRQEVLDDACPVEWVGTRIVTELPEGRSRIVPNRLTYLSAARALPSRLLEANWDQGAEWRDWFVTGLGVDAIELPAAPDITPALDQHLEALHREEQDRLYGALDSDGNDPLALNEELERVSTAKLMIRTQMMLFFPHILIHSDRLREAVAGQNGLLDRRVIGRARQQDVPVDDLLAGAYDRTERFRDTWRALPETVRRRGSIADSVSHAMVRLNAIHEQFFVARPEPAPPVSAPALPRPEGEGEEEAGAEGQL